MNRRFTVMMAATLGFDRPRRGTPALPAGGTPDAALELRATQAFNKGDYATALPMLQKLDGDMTGDPAQGPTKLAMVQEQERVCTRNLAADARRRCRRHARSRSPLSADRKPHPAPKAGQVLDTTIKELGNFDYDPDQNTPIPADVKALSGHARSACTGS